MFRSNHGGEIARKESPQEEDDDDDDDTEKALMIRRLEREREDDEIGEFSVIWIREGEANQNQRGHESRIILRHISTTNLMGMNCREGYSRFVEEQIKFKGGGLFLRGINERRRINIFFAWIWFS